MGATLQRTADGRMPYFPALDGVRAYCMLLVMFDHLKTDGHSITWVNGHLGVDLFFIVSGFLITTLLRREQYFTGRVDLSAFYWRRVFRLLPVYLVVLVGYIGLCHLPGQRLHWVQFKAGLPWFLTLMNEFVREPYGGTVFGHTWSLGVEEKFYLFWPVIFLTVGQRRKSRIAVLVWFYLLVGFAEFTGHGYLGRAYFGLLMGCSMAVLLSSDELERVRELMARLPAWAVLAVFLSGFYAEHFQRHLIVYFSSAAVLFMTHMLVRDSWVRRMHEWGPLVWLGKRSYSMYLVHVVALNLVEGRVRIDSGWKATGVLLVAYGLAAGMAAVLYRTVEDPVRNWGRGGLGRRGEVARAV